MRWWLPLKASTFAGPIDGLFLAILIITGIPLVPVGRPIVVALSSEDVIHSFYVPQFRVRQDAVPGMDIKAWFQATVPGTYELGCSQLCGLGHYRMRAQVFVQTQEEFDAWMKQAAQEASS